jgi:alkylation response protein AidB-like acyl-CoA dehydrogenase
MDLRETERERVLRDELRTWIAANLPEEWRGASGVEIERAWQRRLYDGGWVGVHWPAEHGGRGASAMELAIVVEELALARAPEIVNRVGVNLVGPTLIAHGTPAQRERYLRPILSADEIWCQLYSEPGAGSDLASLQTRAERRGESYVVSGQKVWSSYAHFADFGLALVRTGPDRHRGITCLLVPMRRDGVEVRPLRQITGSSEFNEVFFDSCAVPVENRVGEENDGWRVAMTTLGHERGVGFPVKEWGVQRTIFERLRRTTLRTAPLRDRAARVWTDLEILRLLNLRTISAPDEPGPEASITKLHWAGTSQRLAELGLDACAGDDDWWRARHLWSRAASIAGGSDEVQRNVLAERVLGLPR